ncbi:carboxymuconolactone decarboxylase family protein [Arthrobacter sp. Soil761]|uniref:carboxymuconolactone decarboxylase family protein n=1 Tax=Arthrobacter sp. Soil761 TaxID=1736400 RepID=UPI0019106D0A|nr:carboxymuconolactone decarboxylase family protein [Arthrobacter sp. Soil761]
MVDQAEIRNARSRNSDTSAGMEQGLRVRRQVMGDSFVDKALGKAVDTPSWPLQEHVTEHIWGAVWTRDGLDRRSRSIATLSILVSLRAHEELGGHVRAALTNGLSQEEVVELIIHAGAYCGAPAALSAMRVVEASLNSVSD